MGVRDIESHTSGAGGTDFEVHLCISVDESLAEYLDVSDDLWDVGACHDDFGGGLV